MISIFMKIQIETLLALLLIYLSNDETNVWLAIPKLLSLWPVYPGSLHPTVSYHNNELEP
jgi:hypothetical protein